jgi:hypothetical protein
MLGSLRHTLALLAVALFLVSCGARTPTGPEASSEASWRGTVVVSDLPTSSVVDMTKPLPPAVGAQVTVWETGQTVTTDNQGAASLTLPLGQSPGYGQNEGVYTLDVTTAENPFHTIVRHRFTPAVTHVGILFNPNRDVFSDDSIQDPPQLDVTVIVTQSEGQPVPEATVHVAEQPDLLAITNAQGEAIVYLPEGFYTFMGSAQGRSGQVRQGIFQERPTRVVLQLQ